MIRTAHAMRGDSGKRTIGIKAPSFDGTQPCANQDPELFFPTEKVEEERVKIFAQTLCGRCRFKNECLEWAVTNKEIGIWAGTTDHDRRLILRRIRRK